MRYRSLQAWARQLGSRAETMAGQITVIRRHIAEVQDCTRGDAVNASARGESSAQAYRRDKLRDRITTQREARAASSEEVRAINVAIGRGRTDGARVFVVRGLFPPFGEGKYATRWRGSSRRLFVGDRWLAAVATLPTGALRHTSDLPGQISAMIRRGVRQRFKFGVRNWVPCGVSMALSIEGQPYWEHGATEAECIAEQARKRAIALEERRDQRRARLIARLCRGAMVTAEHVRAAGACMAGIEAWCQARGVEPTGALSLSDLARDRVAAPWALRVAARIRRSA